MLTIKDAELSQKTSLLAIKDSELEQEKERAEQAEEELKDQLAIKEQSEEELKEQLEQEKERAEKAERKTLRVNKFMRRVVIKEKKLEWIYIATTRMYSQERLFKIGSTIRLSSLSALRKGRRDDRRSSSGSRIGGYNTGRPGEDSYYYCWVVKCYSSKEVDYHIQKLLVDFKHKENTELYCGISSLI
jgi:hypothetical protein